MILKCHMRVHSAFICDSDETKLTACQTLHSLYGSTPETVYTDTHRDHSASPESDVYIAGPPCPAYSIASPHATGLSDPRGRVLLDTLEYIVTKRPRLALIENVLGLVSKRHAATFKFVVSCLKAAGYKIYVEEVNTRDHGVPQNRPRVYFVCLRS